ncbi:MAG: hypothetical protein ACYS9C_07180 [Planctomycetota bacterium]|jgi:hypothetical protein
MDIPNFRDIVQKLSVFKNNVSLLVSLIIALVSALLFIPTQLMSGRLEKQIDQASISNGSRVRTWREKPISREQWKEAERRQIEYANDANEIAKLAMQSTQRKLLSYEIFPEPTDLSTLIFKKFGQQFREGVDGLIARAKAGDCPTDVEIERALENSSGIRGTRGGRMGPSMGPPTSLRPSMIRASRNPLMNPYGGGGMYGMMGEVRRTIIDEICLERAQSCSVYVNPVDLAGYEFWADYKLAVDPNTAIEDCWYHQLAYWVIEDIFDTIEAMNSAHDSVLTAPVKRLQRVSFTMGLKRPGAGGGVFTGRSRLRRSSGRKRDEADKPTYVFSQDDGLTESCTGRFTDDDIDVTHFNFSVVIGTKEVLPFMQELCSAKQHVVRDAGSPAGDPNSKHNQITILENKIRSIDQAEKEGIAHRYYRYGEDIVVELDLICEYIFNKKGYDDIKPESAKKVPEVTDTRSRRY